MQSEHQQTRIADIIKCIEDEFNQEKVNQVFKPVFDIISHNDKSLQRKLQLLHNVIVSMRKEMKEFGDSSYSSSVAERNKKINRLKYHRNKNQQPNCNYEINLLPITELSKFRVLEEVNIPEEFHEEF